MESNFINVGEFYHGRNGKKSRLGRAIKTTTTERSVGKTQSPNDIALNKLRRILSDLSGLNSADIGAIIKRITDLQSDQLRFMNMPVLAQVLIYLNTIHFSIDLTNFSPLLIKGYIDKLMPNQPGSSNVATSESEIIRLRLSATFLRYVRFVITPNGMAANELQKLLVASQSIDLVSITDYINLARFYKDLYSLDINVLAQVLIYLRRTNFNKPENNNYLDFIKNIYPDTPLSPEQIEALTTTFDSYVDLMINLRQAYNSNITVLNKVTPEMY